MINKIIYIISFTIMNQWQLPSFLRKLKQMAWINAFTEPFRIFHEDKQLWRESIRYKLQHNGQVIYLEKMLNEYYNMAGYDHQDHVNNRPIYITNGGQLFPTYIFTEAEQKPVYVSTESENEPVYIYSQAELEASYAAFIIKVPASLNFIEAEMRALVDYYLDTRIYKIETY